MRFFKTYLLITIVGSLLFGCKKYPENKLWFKDPKKVFKGGLITSYTENGVDKMKYYRDIYKNFPYNYYGLAIDDIFTIPFEYDSGSEDFNTTYGKGSFHFSKTKREVEISFIPKNSEYGAESVLVRTLSWKIMKLTKDGVLKIKAVDGTKVYEIQFN